MNHEHAETDLWNIHRHEYRNVHRESYEPNIGASELKKVSGAR